MDTVLFAGQPPGFLKLLAHDIRWNILVLLGRSDYSVQEIVHHLALPQNLVSYHLRKLHGQHIVTERRSSADGRDIYIVTVCDSVRESCPTFPGDPERVHWSFIDPAEISGSEKERSRAFEQVALQLMNRIRYLVILIERETSGKI